MSTAAIQEAKATAWKIDSVHSSAQFKVKHMMISNVKGEFAGRSVHRCRYHHDRRPAARYPPEEPGFLRR